MNLYAGIDIGTSGVRCSVIDDAENLIATSAVKLPKPRLIDRRPCQDSEIWWQAVVECLTDLGEALASVDRAARDIVAISVDGTSGTILLADADLRPIAPALMYNSAGFDAEAETIAKNASGDSIAIGSGSGLSRLLFLQKHDKQERARHALHQADWIAARLMKRGGFSDETNSLKTGYDVVARAWPDWVVEMWSARGVASFRKTGRHTYVASIDPAVAAQFGLAEDVSVIAGTTDSCAAFLASGATKIGDGVTSLGTTLAIKLLSPTPVSDSARGVYSHRIGNMWLPGGASNTGGGVLLEHFTVEQMESLQDSIRPDRPTDLDYYPLSRPGERFPTSDPNLPAASVATPGRRRSVSAGHSGRNRTHRSPWLQNSQ